MTQLKSFLARTIAVLVLTIFVSTMARAQYNFTVDGLNYYITSGNPYKEVTVYTQHDLSGDITIPATVTYQGND